MEAKEFLKSKGWTDSDFMDSGMIDFISKLLTEYANESKWISVKEKRPNLYTAVLLYVTKGDFEGIQTGYLTEKGYDVDLMTFYTDDVSHWMPLPKPPKV